MLKNFDKNKNESLIFELTEGRNAGMIGGYCEEGFPLYYANEKMANMLGYDTVAEMATGIEGMVANTLHPEDMDRVVAELNNGNFYEGMSYEVSYRMPRRDGSWFWTIDRGKVIRAEDGRLAILSICTDMTEFVKRQKELEWQQRLSQETMEHMPGAYHQCSMEEGHPFIYISKRFLELFGWSREDIREKFDNKFANMLHPEDREAMTGFVDNIKHHAPGEKRYSQIYRMLGKDGYIWVSDASSQVKLGDREFLHGTLTNITDFVRDRQEKEAQLQESYVQVENALAAMYQAAAEAKTANRAKTAFLNNMSHDIRTPMNAIMGFTQIALKQTSSPEVKNCLEKIKTSSEHLLTLINDVLDISRIESGKVQYKPEPVNIITVIDTVMEIMLGFLADRRLDFQCIRKAPAHPYVLADAVRLREVLVNILSNAVKFTEDGGRITFEAECRPGKNAGDMVAVYRISDTGIGMSDSFVRHIFDEFAQEESSARTRYTGTGLGMAITKRYVELMGGLIRVETQKNKGSIFTLEIPMEAAEEIPAQEEYHTGVSLAGLKVLLVEDNDLNAEIATVQLEDAGLQIVRASNGQEAVGLFRDTPEGTFDVVLMDIMMPVMNGYDATRCIRSLEGRPDGRSIPIIAMTANAFAEDVQRSMDAGLDAHLSKPIVLQEVLETIGRYAGRW